ncbi:hypothetical protein K402DRAFT_246960 [Aulographum hederae CBS 113979]|uniref:Uncharacterized protein n=1 Tax=Aulographum hederae CBS 113979 TaxID=1176131 RepID=A0A6G1HAF8_9PEZI|nr:hypothetical protein K402DRAFT_246960 [Aulographum hederae CBS 113979]
MLGASSLGSARFRAWHQAREELSDHLFRRDPPRDGRLRSLLGSGRRPCVALLCYCFGQWDSIVAVIADYLADADGMF